MRPKPPTVPAPSRSLAFAERAGEAGGMSSSVAEPVRVPILRTEPFTTLWFCAKLAFVVLLFRSLVAAPYVIPSESMMPHLLVGDYLLIAKWPYGWSRYSFPGDIIAFRGRIAAGVPERGDVIVFRAAGRERDDYVKRVIGLPGDTVQMRRGRIILNGVEVPKQRIADLVIDASPNSPCVTNRSERAAFEDVVGGRRVCRYPRYRETLPSGRYYDVLDLYDAITDDTPVITVDRGHVVVLGDNRDRSADSRIATGEGGVGMVPLDHVEGRAMLAFFSTDGSASLYRPWTWAAGTRWSRVGARL